MSKTQPTVFKYERPETDKAKAFVRFFRGDIMRASVQVVNEGGENNLHAHPSTDGFWMVLGGRARFYGEGDAVIADLGVNEGVHIPRGFEYWFASSSEAPLEILHVTASVPGAEGGDRVDLEALKLSQEDKEYLQGSV